MTALSITDTMALCIAFTAILVVGSTHLQLNLVLFALQTLELSVVTACYAHQRNDVGLWVLATLLCVLKAVFVPKFLDYIIKRVGVLRDVSVMIPTPFSMHFSIGLMIVSCLLAQQLPLPVGEPIAWPTAASSISLVCTGLILMLTRRIAISQIVGFLIIENGIYLFGIAQTRGMPLLIEMGIMLDLIAAVLIAGLIIFRIKRSFEHIDVTMLSELRE